MKADEITKQSKSPREYMRKVAEALVMIESEGVVLPEIHWKSLEQNEKKSKAVNTNYEGTEYAGKSVSIEQDPSLCSGRNVNVSAKPNMDLGPNPQLSWENPENNHQYDCLRDENFEDSHGSNQGTIPDALNEQDEQGPSATILNEVFGITDDELLLSYPSVENYTSNEAEEGEDEKELSELMRL